MGYGGLIRDAFRITWRNRFLWFFGLFVGTTAGPSFNFSFGGDSTPDGRTADGGLGVDPAVVVGVVVGLLVLGIVVLALHVVSQGALGESVAAIAAGERRSFWSAWRAGRAAFWRMLGQVLMMLLIGILAFVAIAVPLTLLVGGVFVGTDEVGPRVAVVVVGVVLAIAAFILVYVPYSVVLQLAAREVVLAGARPIAAIRGGFGLLRRNLGRCLLVFLIQFGIGIGAALALTVATLLVGLVLALPAILLAAAGPTAAAIAAGVGAGLLLFSATLVAFGALGTFGHAFWTLAYLRLRAGDAAVPPVPATEM